MMGLGRLFRRKAGGRAEKEPKVWAPDREWTEAQWLKLLKQLVSSGELTWKDVTALVLGQMNPPQVGTSLASDKQVQDIYGKGQTWQKTKEWLYRQTGRCCSCGTRLDLQADHIRAGSEGGTSRLENLQLLCRRCNVVKRPSHKQGGLTFLTAESALMWLLLTYRPKTYGEFKVLCRRYGLTMADIRFQEAWAMALWLSKEGKYEIKG